MNCGVCRFFKLVLVAIVNVKNDLFNLKSLPNKNLHPIFFKPSALIPLMERDRGKEIETKQQTWRQVFNSCIEYNHYINICLNKIELLLYVWNTQRNENINICLILEFFCYSTNTQISLLIFQTALSCSRTSIFFRLLVLFLKITRIPLTYQRALQLQKHIKTWYKYLETTVETKERRVDQKNI